MITLPARISWAIFMGVVLRGKPLERALEGAAGAAGAPWRKAAYFSAFPDGLGQAA
jgi:hypothetical protein